VDQLAATINPLLKRVQYRPEFVSVAILAMLIPTYEAYMCGS
jgi:hypothetical protein